MLSIICPIYQEEKYIAKCINSILIQDYPQDDMEILFVDGMSTDRTREIIEVYQRKYYSLIRLLDNPYRTVPYAMNVGIAAAKGDTIIRLDAHAEYPDNYFSELTKYLYQLDGAENVGGVCITLPCNESSRGIAIAAALSSTFGIGNSYFRTGCREIKSVDTVPFGCFRACLFKIIGLYDYELVRNQDDELNGRIVKNGGKIYLIPDIRIKYYARDEIQKVRGMFYQYGLYKPLVNKKLGSPMTFRQFFPVLFVLGLFFGCILGLCSKFMLATYLGVLVAYVIIGVLIGAKQAFGHHRFSLMVIMPFLFFIIHTSYGVGYIDGMFRVLTNKSFNAKSNR